MRILTILALTIFISTSVIADGIKFHKGDWSSALAAAKAQDKLIFMDAYTTWCGPCKMMSRDVFPNKAVGEFFNKNFINVKMDMEKGEGKTLAQKYRVNAYPTLLFIDGDGKIVHVDKGMKPADRFLKLGKFALNKFDKSGEYAQMYENGKRDADFLKKYAYALKRGNKPFAKIANEYLQTQEDFTTSDNLKFIFDLTASADSRIFSLMTEYKSAILKSTDYDEADFKEKVVEAALNTVQSAVEFKTEDLLKEAKTAVKKHAKSEYKAFALKADMKYYGGIGDEQKFLKAANGYVKKFAKSNAVELNKTALEVLNVCKSATAFKKAEKWAEKAVSNGGRAEYYLTYAKLLMKQGKKDSAIQAAKKGYSVARENRENTTPFEVLIRELNQKV